MEKAMISAVTYDTSEAKVTVQGVPDRPGIAAALFRTLADLDVMVDMIVQNTSEDGRTDISFTVPSEHLALAQSACQDHADDLGALRVLGDDAIAKVSLVGAGMKSHPGVSATVFEVLATHGINIEMISTSSIRITCVVRTERMDEAVQALHNAFELERPVV